MRDDLYMNDPRQYAGIKTVSDRGIKFNMIMGNPGSPDSAEAYVNTVATQPRPARSRASKAATSGTSSPEARLCGRSSC